MRVQLNKIDNNPFYNKILQWGKLIAITGGAQAVVQAAGLVCGILVIRLLSIQEYAWYILANTMLGTMGVLADAGISTGVMAIGGTVWEDKEKMGAVLATGLYLRNKFAIASMLVALPVLMYLLFHHGAGFIKIILITASIIPSFSAALSDSLLEIVPKLRQEISALQKNQIIVAVWRLVLSAFTLFIFPFTFVAIVAAGLPRIYGNNKLTKIVNGLVNKNQLPDPEIKKKILKFVGRILPGSIYYCLSGQITIWLISFFGNTAAIAKVGALGRLAMLLGFFSTLFNTLITPRFARLPYDRKLLLTRFTQILIVLSFFGAVIIGCSFIFSGKALWILGAGYSNLQTEFVLSIVAGFFGLFAGVLFAINTARGWMVHPILSISINLFAIVAGIYFLNITSIQGLFIFNIFIMAVDVLLYIGYGFFRILNMETVKKEWVVIPT